MLFNSYDFVLYFFPLVLCGYYILNYSGKYQLSKVFLLTASLYFYGYFKPSYLLIIVGSILVNYTFSKLFGYNIFSGGWKRRILFVVAIGFNLGIIGYYKYYDFVAKNINIAFQANLRLINVLLPLGISFFTFQQLSFVIDCYKKEAEEYTLLDYALFVCYFPQLIAGPIVTHDELVPQIEDKGNKRFNAESFSKGIMALAFGMAKKVLIADTFGNVVNWAFSNVSALSSSDALLAMLAYTFQIYFDFSGYCDMATGIGLMMNISLPQNFNSPYRALSISEFWKRWHMTLTRFFTRYIYIPLGGNRKGIARACLNVFIVYLCSGIWHGANWTFIVWGIMHGVACIADRLTKKQTERWHPVFRWMITFVFVNVTWVFFRADTLEQAVMLIQRIGMLEFKPIQEGIYSAFYSTVSKRVMTWLLPNEYRWVNSKKPALILMTAYFVFTWFATLNMKNTNERIQEFKPTITLAIVTAVLMGYSVLSLSGISTFLYFNF